MSFMTLPQNGPENCCPPPPAACAAGCAAGPAAGGAERARAAALFRILADPTRLDVLALIAAQEEALCVCEIVARFDVSQPTISHHLKLLREAHLVSAERRGTWSFYSLDPRGTTAARAALDAVLGTATTRERTTARTARQAARAAP